MILPVQEFLENVHNWQLDILRFFDKQTARFYVLNWHRRARKTTLAINLLIREAARYPKRMYGYIAPTYTMAKSIVWLDPNMLKRYLPVDLVKRKNESELLIELHNESFIRLFGADKPDSLRGIDLAGVVLDEYALMKPEIWAEILRPIIAQDPKRWAMFIATPKGQNHFYDLWAKATNLEGWHRSMLPVSVSNLLPKPELIKARDEMPGGLYEQEFECSFLANEENCLIQPQEIEALKSVVYPTQMSTRLISCDPATGGDECVIQAFKGTEIIEQKILHVRDSMVIAGEIAVMMNKHHADIVAVDAIGIGKGIADRLKELGRKVVYIISSETAIEKDKFLNRRAEMWWFLADLIRRKEIIYPEDPEIRRELISIKYKLLESSGKIQIEGKDKTKVLLGRSPDRADAFVYGIWALFKERPGLVKIKSTKDMAIW